MEGGVRGSGLFSARFSTVTYCLLVAATTSLLVRLPLIAARGCPPRDRR